MLINTVYLRSKALFFEAKEASFSADFEAKSVCSWPPCSPTESGWAL